MALPNMTPCSPFKSNTPPHACPPPSEGEPREKELVGGGRWCSLEKHCGSGIPGRAPFQACSESTSGEPPGPLQQFLREDSGLGGHRRPGPKASWLQSKQLAGSSFSPGPRKHHFRPSSPCLGSSWLDRCLCPSPPSLCRAFSLPHNPYFALSVSISISSPSFSSSPASLLLAIPHQPQNGSPSLSPSPTVSPPALALTPAPLSLYSSRPLPASPASLLPPLASTSPSLPIFSSVSSPWLLSPPLSLTPLPASIPGFLSTLGVSVPLILLSTCLLPHRRLSRHPSFSAQASPPPNAVTATVSSSSSSPLPTLSSPLFSLPL